MKIVSVINYKGGVGKTTLTANLGGELAFRGHNVLLIDLDPQASLTFSFIRPEDWRRHHANTQTIKELFKEHPSNLNDLIIEPDVVQQKLDEGILHLVSSHLELINVDLELATRLAGANISQSKRNFLRVHRILAEALMKVNKAKYDIVLIDCPPNFNIVTKNAIVASDFILIPAKPDYLSTMGIDYLITSVKRLTKEYNEYRSVDDDLVVDAIKPKVEGVVFTMVQYYGGVPVSHTRPFIDQTRNLSLTHRFRVFDNQIRENKTLFADAPQQNVPAVLTSNYRGIADEIKAFVDEFTTVIRL